MRHIRIVLPVVIGVYCLLLAQGQGVQAKTPPQTMTKKLQNAMTPDAALKQLIDGNKRYVSGAMFSRKLAGQSKQTAEGQYPFASILSCIDSRTTPEFVFDQGIGDVFVARVAGNYATPDILGSLEYASKVVGSKLIVVLGHSSCGAVKGACDNVDLGNITSIVKSIRPSVDAIANDGTDRSSKNHEFVEKVADNNIRRTMSDIKMRSPILREMIAKGEVKLVGAMLELTTGKITWISDES